MSKVPCTICGKAILPMTAQINSGLCAGCVKTRPCSVCGDRTLHTPDGFCLVCRATAVPASSEALSYQSIEAWLTAVLPIAPPPKVIAYNFNLSEGGGWVVELIGSSAYDAKNKDWACPPEAWTSRPSEYLVDYDEASNWQAALDHVVVQVTKFLQTSTLPGAKVLKSAQAVCAGFVDGELTQIWPKPPPNKSLERKRGR